MALKTAARSFLKRPSAQNAIALWVSILFLMMPISVLANSPPPPPMTWFDFQSWPEALEAVQVLECDTETCTNPHILSQSGQCSLSGCVTPSQDTPDAPKTTLPLTCRGKTCLMSGDTSSDSSERKLHLRVQSGDRLWQSPTITEPRELEYAWQISRRDSALQVDLINPWERQEHPALFWGLGFLLTLGTEALILALTLKWLGKDRKVWSRTFVSFGLMHLVTYPLVWLLPTGLMFFPLKTSRVVGWEALLIAVSYLAILFPLRRQKSWKLSLGSLILLPCAFFAAIIIALFFGYGQQTPLTTGLPYNLALGITESIITLLEAGFLTILSREMLSFPYALLISLLMNGASVLMGLVFWQYLL